VGIGAAGGDAFEIDGLRWFRRLRQFPVSVFDQKSPNVAKAVHHGGAVVSG
jgi:hypothetical protein